MGSPERAVARIDLGAVERNCAHLRSLLTNDTRLCAVVKANGYGHGDVDCGRAAVAGGAEWLAVATAAEARTLRDAGIESRLLVMGALTRDSLGEALAAGADVVAWTGEFLAAAAESAGAGPARVHVKLDTGMGRLGTRDPALARTLVETAAADDRLELAGLMTHFATADVTGDDHFPAQLAAFEDFLEGVRGDHPEALVHAANSAAVYRDPASHFDLVRCGIAIYGLDPFLTDAGARGLEPALSLESYVAAVKRLDAGDSAGYGRSWCAERPTWLGVLPIGYADGWRRALSNNCDVLVGGRRVPLVGTISMDNITVDLGPDAAVEPGATAVLIGRQGEERIACEEVAAAVGTINYEITCGIGPRVPRVGAGEPGGAAGGLGAGAGA